MFITRLIIIVKDTFFAINNFNFIYIKQKKYTNCKKINF